MKILKNILGKKARLYHIYTDNTPRYVGGSAGIEFFNGNILLAIRYSTAIAIEGRPNFNEWFFNRITPYMNYSICRIGKISPEEFGKDNLIHVQTETIRGILPDTDKNVYKGLEDTRIMIWNGQLYIYGTQYTNIYPVSQGMICYQMGEDQITAVQTLEFPGAWFYCNRAVYTEKNWMAIPGEKKDFIYALISDGSNIIPVKYSDLDNLKHNSSRLECISSESLNNIAFRGSTPLLKYKKGYVCLVHNSTHDDLKGLDYTHNLCFIDENFTTATVSEGFKFEQPGIEFSTGWCEDDKKNLYISYSTTDGTTNVLVTTLKDLISAVMKDKEYGEIKENSEEIAQRLYKTNPTDAAQYYWKDWLKTGNRDSLYSHYAILLHYLDRYLLPDTLKCLKDDNSVDAMVLKIYNHRRVSRDFNIFYDMLRSLPENWKKMITNKYIKEFNFEKIII